MSTQQSAVTGKSADCHLRRGVIHLSVRLSVCLSVSRLSFARPLAAGMAAGRAAPVSSDSPACLACLCHRDYNSFNYL